MKCYGKILHRLILLFMVTLILCVQTACSFSEQKSNIDKKVADPSGSPIVIGAKPATEQLLFMKMTALMLREKGFPVKELTFSRSAAVRHALEAGAIDLYWEYTNTALINYHKSSPVYDPDEAFHQVADRDLKLGLIWLPKSNFNSTWVIFIRKDLAGDFNIETISDLARYANQLQEGWKGNSLTFATNSEFLVRGDGIERLREVYGLPIQAENIMEVDNNLLAQAVKEARVQAAVGWVADSKIAEYGLKVIKDDQQVFPPYHVAPVIRESTLNREDSIQEILGKISERLTNETVLDLTYRVDVLHQDVFKVAKDFLIQQDLIGK